MKNLAIPVMRPRLPDADSLMPLLRRIDDAQIYSNMGPLAQELGARLSARYDCPALPVANATAGLTIALLASQAPRGSLCMVPAWTFVASAQAILAAGLVPFIVDVDETIGALTPDLAERWRAHAPAAIGAVMVVSVFGQPVDLAGWQEFRRRHNAAVIIDAAAGFDTALASDLPSVVSLHATKVLGCGEGGFILCRDPDIHQRCIAASNFGFAGQRHASMVGLNGKISEYHAAIALAALDQWPQQRQAFVALLTQLRRRLTPKLDWPAGLGETMVTNTLTLAFPGGWQAASRHFAAHGIETRRWWGDGLHRQQGFAACPRLPTPQTDRLAAVSLGLPCWLGLDEAQMDRIAGAAADLI